MTTHMHATKYPAQNNYNKHYRKKNPAKVLFYLPQVTLTATVNEISRFKLIKVDNVMFSEPKYDMEKLAQFYITSCCLSIMLMCHRQEPAAQLSPIGIPAKTC